MSEPGSTVIAVLGTHSDELIETRLALDISY
jgi:hypothetical protein